MRVARCRPLLGWLRLDGHTYSRTLDQSLRERNRALELDRNHSGHAEGFVDWAGLPSCQNLYVMRVTTAQDAAASALQGNTLPKLHRRSNPIQLGGLSKHR